MAKISVLAAKTKNVPQVTEAQIVGLFSRLELVMMALRAVDLDRVRAGWPPKAVKTMEPLLCPAIANLDCGMSAADYRRFAIQVRAAYRKVYGLAGEDGAAIEYCLRAVADELECLAIA